MNAHAHGSFNHLDFINSLVQFDLFKLLFLHYKISKCKNVWLNMKNVWL